jgi:hypothetical protein
MRRPVPIRFDWKNSALSTEFGRKWATDLFGQEAIDSLPVLKSGKNKGQPKGYVHWRKAATAGWCSEISSPVAVGNLIDAWIGEGPCSLRGNAIAGQWMGRVQELAGSRSMLFQEARDREAREQTRRRADDQAMFGESAQEQGKIAKAIEYYTKAAEMYASIGRADDAKYYRDAIDTVSNRTAG